MIIKKVFDGMFDDKVHSAFLKFGKGEFKNRYLVECKKQKGKWAVKTSSEFANSLVRKCLENIKEDKISVSGIIICTFNLKNDISFKTKKVSNFRGVRKIEIDTDISPKEILELMKKYPRAFFALSFKMGDDSCELKIKPKAPKNAKPGKNGEEIKADFCSLKTTDESLVKELLFDVDLNSAKEVKVNHTIKVNEIIYPSDIAGMKPEEIREKSKRKGVIVREVEVDGVKKTNGADFEA